MSARLKCLVYFASTRVNALETKVASWKWSGLLILPARFVPSDFHTYSFVLMRWSLPEEQTQVDADAKEKLLSCEGTLRLAFAQEQTTIEQAISNARSALRHGHYYQASCTRENALKRFPRNIRLRVNWAESTFISEKICMRELFCSKGTLE